MIASLGIAAVSFVFNERVLTRSNKALYAWQQAEYGPLPEMKNAQLNVWVRDGNNLIHADAVAGHDISTRLRGVTVYMRTKGRLISIVSARSAGFHQDSWRLENATRFIVASGKSEQLPFIDIGHGITPDRFTLADVNADQLNFLELRQAIQNLEKAGRPTGPLQAALHHKISGPLAAVLMPLLGAVAGFGLARSGKLFIRTVLGMALGFAYFIGDNFALALGNLGAIPPILAAWAPFLLFYLIGEAVLFKTEE